MNPGRPKEDLSIFKTPTPKHITNIRRFLPLTSYYRIFIKLFAQIAGPLHEVSSRNAKFNLDYNMDKDFQLLKSTMCEPRVLAYPSFDKPSIVETDTSRTAFGAVLSRKGGDAKVHHVHCETRSFNSAEKNYSTC